MSNVLYTLTVQPRGLDDGFAQTYYFTSDKEAKAYAKNHPDEGFVMRLRRFVAPMPARRIKGSVPKRSNT